MITSAVLGTLFAIFRAIKNRSKKEV